jgi:protein-S-isoprenylcysteine O-methyltransferase Ste14
VKRIKTVEYLKSFSVAGYALMVLALVPMVYFRVLFSSSPIVIIIQVLAVFLMVWAHLTFGSRSFHYAADATKGGLVTTGPYKYIRHPIYSAIAFFVGAGVAANLSWVSVPLLLLEYLGIGVRVFCEERLVIQEYPEYAEYARRTKRVIPFVF